MEQSNLEYWEQLAGIHGFGNDRYYDVTSLVEGGSLMGREERDALARATRGAGVGGLDVMHLQCHIGCDAITMAREGARVTGVDFSPTALSRLDSLAHDCGVDVRTVKADARRLPHHLDDSFDLVYASIGVTCWIDDIGAWMEGVARVLREGGALVVVDFHPLLQMIDSVDPLVIDFPYNFDEGHEYIGVGSYANREADVSWTTKQYAHGLAELVVSALDAGLRIRHLEEHTPMGFDPRGMGELSDESEGRFRLRIGRGSPAVESVTPGEPLPVLFTLIADKPPSGNRQIRT